MRERVVLGELDDAALLLLGQFLAVRLAAGESVGIDEVMLAMQKAELALDLFLETRNKVVQAYQEIMRMQISTSAGESVPRRCSAS